MTDLTTSFRPGRRQFLGGVAAMTAGVAAGVNPFAGLSALAASGRPPREAGASDGGYGPLVATPPSAPVPANPYAAVYNDSTVNWLALPEGFQYVVFGVSGTTMTDGNRTPQAHDGMGAFGYGDNVRLVRNHENRNSGGSGVPPIGGPANAYDPLGAGGNTTVELAFPNGVPTLVKDFVSLNGTIVNCAGGETPWDSWISCEETTETRNGITHGWNFDIPAAADSPITPVPLKKMGRFSHEAVAVDPSTGWVYETEDAGDSGFYRFIPASYGDLTDGTLQMLKVRGRDNYNTKTGQHIARALPVEWVTIDDPEATGPSTYVQGADQGGAVFARLEGCWWGNGSVYFSSTNGGDVGQGQIWEYQPAGPDNGILRLMYESPDPEVLTFPDNVNVTPRGGVLLCEDTGYRRTTRNFQQPAPFAEQFIKGLTRDGRIFDVAVNLLDNREWAGACWSPDGNYLFVNTQGETTEPGSVPGRTYAIWGDWARGAL
jgi:secreted PhoX family phosphatase